MARRFQVKTDNIKKCCHVKILRSEWWITTKGSLSCKAIHRAAIRCIRGNAFRTYKYVVLCSKHSIAWWERGTKLCFPVRSKAASRTVPNQNAPHYVCSVVQYYVFCRTNYLCQWPNMMMWRTNQLCLATARPSMKVRTVSIGLIISQTNLTQIPQVDRNQEVLNVKFASHLDVNKWWKPILPNVCSLIFENMTRKFCYVSGGLLVQKHNHVFEFVLRIAKFVSSEVVLLFALKVCTSTERCPFRMILQLWLVTRKYNAARCFACTNKSRGPAYCLLNISSRNTRTCLCWLSQCKNGCKREIHGLEDVLDAPPWRTNIFTTAHMR